MKNRARVLSAFQGHGRVVRSCGKQNMMEETNTARGRYWQANLKCVGVLLSIWFFVSYGCGILLRDWLDANFPNVGTAPFGFWMAQQGAIICFVLPTRFSGHFISIHECSHPSPIPRPPRQNRQSDHPRTTRCPARCRSREHPEGPDHHLAGRGIDHSLPGSSELSTNQRTRRIIILKN